MNEALLDLEPAGIWKYFKEILMIPRPSKHEEQIVAYLLSFAHAHQLDVKQDKVGNVLISKPASPGFENRQTVVIQSHIDMVCEKNSDKVHDFFKDPIETYIEDGWVKAKGTTLGADDGIGVAAQLAILADKSIQHGPLECLFTIDEETGLSGAFGLEPGFVKGRILLNVDSEDEGELFIGCAGGKDTVVMLPFQKTAVPEGHQAFKLAISGLAGGHSGDDIHKGRGNANKLLVRILYRATNEFGALLSHIEGGNLRNAIAREAHAIILLPAENASNATATLIAMGESLRSEFAITEPKLEINLTPWDGRVNILVESEDQQKLINSLYACPHGVMAYSQSIPGFVETSTNLASVRMINDTFEITTSQRSSVESAKADVVAMVAACFKLTGATVKHSNGYPGWAPNPSSAIRDITETAYVKLFGNKPEVKAIHAGLECGLIGDVYSGMDMISYGPTIKGAHSPDERLEIQSVTKFWDLTLEILRQIP